MRLALLTYTIEEKKGTNKDFLTEDQILVNYLRTRGIDITLEVWQDPEVNWSSYNAVILKSNWDYVDKLEEFLQWLDTIKSLNVRVINPINTVRWNCDKSYLLDISQEGFSIAPTEIVQKDTKNIDLSQFFERFNTENLVIKPSVGGSGKNVHLVTKSEAKAFTEIFIKLLEKSSYLVQQFIPLIKTAGEHSILFFNGKMSHCILKIPKADDFRVQSHFGGTYRESSVSESTLETVQNLLNRFATDCLYARVDGIEYDGKFMLMELELIEPYYFIQRVEVRLENFFLALKEYLNI